MIGDPEKIPEDLALIANPTVEDGPEGTSGEEAVAELNAENSRQNAETQGNGNIHDSESDNIDASASQTTAETASNIIERLDEICKWLDEANQISQDRERIIDRLHQENQRLRGGEMQQAMMPIYRDLVRLHDDLLQTARRYLAEDPSTHSTVSQDFQSYSDEIADILFRYGIERYEAAEGDHFNPKEHRALAAISTADPNLDRKIAKVIRLGFRMETRSVRLLEAEVYRAMLAEAENSMVSDQPDSNR